MLPGRIEFYCRAFEAQLLSTVLRDPKGRIVHAELRVGNNMLMPAEEIPEWGNQSPESLGGTPLALHLYVEDVDAVTRRAVEAGAEVVIPVADQFYGDRTGRIADPFGHVWIVATHIEDMSPQEMQRRFDEWLQQTSQEN